MLGTCLCSSTHTLPSMRCAAWTSRCTSATLSLESPPCPPQWKVSAALGVRGEPGLWPGLGRSVGGVSCCSALGLDREEAALDPSWEQHPWVLAVGMECAGLSFLASPIWRFHRLMEERGQSRVLAPGFGSSSATYLLSGADAHLI